MAIAGSRRIIAPTPRVAEALAHPRHWEGTPDHPAFAAAPTPEQRGETEILWRAESATVTFALASDGVGTQLAYEAEGAAADGMKPALEGYLDKMQADLAGPAEVAAQGPVIGAVKMAGGSGLSSLPRVIFGMPLIFWAGTAIFLFVFVMMFGAYL